MTDGFSFEVTARCGKARTGVLRTPRGVIETPAFMPVGTLGAVKAMTARELGEVPIDARVILGNTYHLYLRPGLDVIREHGGLHRFAGWSRAILTDSGGFQVFSLARLSRQDDDGVTFRSHIDGTQHRLTPEKVMEIQAVLGSDIAMVLDVCPPAGASDEEHDLAMKRTTAWAHRALDVPRPPGQALFGIVQGGPDPDRRRRHMEAILPLSFDGFALGGLSVGEGPEQMGRVLDAVAWELPEERPRYLMGVGTPQDLSRGVAAGIDLFDCVLPTRNARNGTLYTSEGRLVISHARYRADTSPIDPVCECETCKTVSRSYLRHLYQSREVLYSRLATLHNLAFYAGHMRRLRSAIAAGTVSA